MSSSKIMANSLDDSVFNGIAEMMQELKTDIATMKESLATKSDLDTLANTVTSSVGAVKSVQKLEANAGFGTYYQDFTISAVNVEKTFVIEGADFQYEGGGYYAIKLSDTNDYIMRGYLASSTTIRVMKYTQGKNEVFRKVFYVVELK